MEKRRRIDLAYWAFTLALLGPFGFGGVMDILRPPYVVEVIRRLGYPDYFPLMLGAAKVAGVAALLLPIPFRVKEWAYAGFTFNMLAASISHLIVGDPFARALIPLGVLALVAASYTLARARRET